MSPRGIAEGELTGQDDCLEVWAVAGEAAELMPRLEAQVTGSPLMDKGIRPLFPQHLAAPLPLCPSAAESASSGFFLTQPLLPDMRPHDM